MASQWHLGLLFILGLGVFGGILGAWVFQRIRIPQVVGYIAIGLLIGESGVHIVTANDVETFRQLTLFALGIIGFLVGGELQGSTFKRYGRQFIGILLGEGLLSFALVTVFTGTVVYLVIGNFPAALAAGIVFGAIASATDPASTIDVLWEYRCAGPLTTAIVATVALDDALAMTLYGLGSTAANMIMGETGSLSDAAGKIAIELFGSLGLGVGAGFVLAWTLRYLHQAEKALALAIGTILLVIAIAARLNMDVILATMAMGVVLVNVSPLRSKQLFETVRSFSTPIYVVFFVLIGAKLSVASMPTWLWLIIGLYLLFRTGGKMIGAFIGARATKAPMPVQKYTGLGLFAQGGVAVGLSIMAAHHLTMEVAGGLRLADMIVFTVTATTLVVQVLGPPMVKLAVKLADEIGRDVTEEDVVRSLKVRNVMSADVATIAEHEPVAHIIQLFSDNDHLAFPVVDTEGHMTGVLSLDAIKNLLASRDTWQWLVAADVMMPIGGALAAGDTLRDAMATMTEAGLEQMPVVDDDDARHPVGILDLRKARQQIKREVVRRRQSTLGPAIAAG